MGKTQKYGIKFPFNIISDYKTLLDLNITKSDRVRSQLMHLIFTQKGQRLRLPDFGTNLLQFIFNPNDLQTWDDVQFEIKESVKKWVPDCNLNNITIYETDSGRSLIAELKYSVTEDNGTTTEHKLVTNL